MATTFQTALVPQVADPRAEATTKFILVASIAAVLGFFTGRVTGDKPDHGLRRTCETVFQSLKNCRRQLRAQTERQVDATVHKIRRIAKRQRRMDS